MKKINELIKNIDSFLSLAESEEEKAERELMNERFRKNRNDPMYKAYIKRITEKQKQEELIKNKLFEEQERKRQEHLQKNPPLSQQEQIDKIVRDYREKMTKNIKMLLQEHFNVHIDDALVQWFFQPAQMKVLQQFARAQIDKDDKKIKILSKKILQLVKQYKMEGHND